MKVRHPRTGTLQVYLLCVFAFLVPRMALRAQCAERFRTRASLAFDDGQIAQKTLVSRVELHLVNGSFESIDSIPSGWTVTIRNQRSGEALLEAQATSGASPLDAKAIDNLDIVILKDRACGEPFDVDGWLTTGALGVPEKRLPFSAMSFRIVDHYHRRKLVLRREQP